MGDSLYIEQTEKRGRRSREGERERRVEKGEGRIGEGPGEREGYLTKHDDIDSIQVLFEQLVQPGLVS